MTRELAPKGTTINNIQPGPIVTDMNPEDTEFADKMRQVMAAPRYGHPEDVARVVSFLAGEDAWYITGAHWNVDNGYTVYRARPT